MSGRWYAGVGSRETPEDVLTLFTDLGEQLANQGWCLRSGAAHGADAAFESGAVRAGGDREIFLPTAGFNGHRGGIAVDQLGSFPEALQIAASLHPAWDRLDAYVRKLMARNVMQVLGADLQSPCRFVVCWAKGSRFKGENVVDAVGGSGQAVRLAAARGIEVFNAYEPAHRARVERFLTRRHKQDKGPSLRP
jgi:hypothetical protein